jgi:hypothetical protein
MTNLRDIPWKISYGPQDDRLRDFFIPAMAASIRYDRAAGYFSSTMLAVAAVGVTKLILNGGKMRLLCGADLSEDDVQAIDQGHATLAQQVEQQMITRWVLPESDYVENRLKALAWLVGTGQLEIMVVLPTDKHGRPLAASKSDSYYHPKEGLFEDAAGNCHRANQNQPLGGEMQQPGDMLKKVLLIFVAIATKCKGQTHLHCRDRRLSCRVWASSTRGAKWLVLTHRQVAAACQVE